MLDGPTSVDTAHRRRRWRRSAGASTPTRRRAAGPDRTARLNELGGAATATVVLGLVSAVAWGCGDFGGGLLARRTALFGVVLISQFVGMVLALGLTVLRGETAPRPLDLVWSVLGGVAGGIGITALYQGLAVGRMGIVAPVTGVIAALIPVAAGIVLEGVPPPLVLVGIALAIVAVVLVSRVSDEASGPSGLRFALVAGVGIGVQRLHRADQRGSRVRAAGRHPRGRGGLLGDRRRRDAAPPGAPNAGCCRRSARRGPRHGRQRRVHPRRPGRRAGGRRRPVVALPGDDGHPGGGLPARARHAVARGRDRAGGGAVGCIAVGSA